MSDNRETEGREAERDVVADAQAQVVEEKWEDPVLPPDDFSDKVDADDGSEEEQPDDAKRSKSGVLLFALLGAVALGGAGFAYMHFGSGAAVSDLHKPMVPAQSAALPDRQHSDAPLNSVAEATTVPNPAIVGEATAGVSPTPVPALPTSAAVPEVSAPSLPGGSHDVAAVDAPVKADDNKNVLPSEAFVATSPEKSPVELPGSVNPPASGGQAEVAAPLKAAELSAAEAPATRSDLPQVLAAPVGLAKPIEKPVLPVVASPVADPLQSTTSVAAPETVAKSTTAQMPEAVAPQLPSNQDPVASVVEGVSVPSGVVQDGKAGSADGIVSTLQADEKAHRTVVEQKQRTAVPQGGTGEHAEITPQASLDAKKTKAEDKTSGVSGRHGAATKKSGLAHVADHREKKPKTNPTKHTEQSTKRASYIIRSAMAGEAWVVETERPDVLIHVRAGDALSGLGKVKSVGEDGGAWQIVTDRGILRGVSSTQP